MRNLLIAASALALATPAFGQTTGTMGSTATPPASAQMPPSSADTTAAATATTPADPKAVIASEFPTYDKDGNGSLSSIEFGTWMSALKDKSGGAAMSATEKSDWLKGVFASADTDKNKTVTQVELTTYLTAGA